MSLLTLIQIEGCFYQIAYLKGTNQTFSVRRDFLTGVYQPIFRSTEREKKHSIFDPRYIKNALVKDTCIISSEHSLVLSCPNLTLPYLIYFSFSYIHNT